MGRWLDFLSWSRPCRAAVVTSSPAAPTAPAVAPSILVLGGAVGRPACLASGSRIPPRVLSKFILLSGTAKWLLKLVLLGFWFFSSQGGKKNFHFPLLLPQACLIICQLVIFLRKANVA